MLLNFLFHLSLWCVTNHLSIIVCYEDSNRIRPPS
nr:MAG TPA: hypothetical protein [Caudoviricetes sp.]